MTKPVYFLFTFWLISNDIDTDKHGSVHKNLVTQGFWETKEEAEEYLMDNWFNLHEYWNNTACIQEIYQGPLTPQSWDFKYWYYQSENIDEQLPVEIESPLSCKVNSRKHNIMLL